MKMPWWGWIVIVVIVIIIIVLITWMLWPSSEPETSSETSSGTSSETSSGTSPEIPSGTSSGLYDEIPTQEGNYESEISPAPTAPTGEAIDRALAEAHGFYPTSEVRGSCQGKTDGLYGHVMYMKPDDCTAMGGAFLEKPGWEKEVYCRMDAGKSGPLGLLPPTYTGAGSYPGEFTMQGKVCRAFGGTPVNSSLGDDKYGRCKGVIGPIKDSRHFIVPANTSGSIGHIRYLAQNKGYCDRVGGVYNPKGGDWNLCDMGVKPLTAY